MMRRLTAKLLRITCAAVSLAAFAPRASAIQLLIRPGDEWSTLAAKAHPGDEIILMPGTHKSATLDGLCGTADAPIVIRSIDSDHVALIEANREGLRLRRPRNVIIQNLTISGASVAGVYISDEDYARPGEPAQPRSAEGYGDVTIQRVNILKTGPKGQRHAMALMGLENVRVEQCAIVGWGGSGIEIVACRNVHVSQCSVRGLDDFTQNQGIRIRAGSEHVVIDQCRLESPGAFGISIGGTSKPVEFRLVPSTAPASARTIEANDVSIERSIIKGGEISVDIISALNCRLRSNSIINPTACVIRAASLKSAPPSRGELAVEGLHLTSNLFIWEAGRIQRLMDLTNSVDKSMVQVEQNLWWSPETDAEKEHRGNVEGTILFDQVLNVDPRLDDSFHPANSAAELFGTFGP